MPGAFLPRKNLPSLWIALKYEKLADVCYRCGLVSHETRNCQGEAFLLHNPFGHEFIVAGLWLRAEHNGIPTEAFSKPIHPTPSPSPVSDCTSSQTSPQGQNSAHFLRRQRTSSVRF